MLLVNVFSQWLESYISSISQNEIGRQVATKNMSSTTSTTASRLSFDVLGIIFSYYAQEETIFHPLETLLLVCKSWNEAALGHRALWTRLAIHIKHSPSHKIWKTRLPLRLERSGTSLPLHIDLRNMLPADPAEWRDPQHARFEYEPCIPTPYTNRSTEVLTLIALVSKMGSSASMSFFSPLRVQMGSCASVGKLFILSYRTRRHGQISITNNSKRP
jgi:F-box-like